MNYNDPNDMWRHNGYDPYKGMSDEERMKAGCMQLVSIVCAVILALLICALFNSCTTTKYVQVPVVNTDTTVITKHQRDSIYVHDSTFVKEKGDTMLIERWHTQWRDRIVRDTIYQTRVVTRHERALMAQQTTDSQPSSSDQQLSAEQMACSMLCDDIPYELLATP